MDGESKLFKGFNIYKNILDTDDTIVKREKIAHNSKYQLYSNIINLACLYKNVEFYLPVYTDYYF